MRVAAVDMRARAKRIWYLLRGNSLHCGEKDARASRIRFKSLYYASREAKALDVYGNTPDQTNYPTSAMPLLQSETPSYIPIGLSSRGSG